jgi:hypothetical protein
MKQNNKLPYNGEELHRLLNEVDKLLLKSKYGSFASGLTRRTFPSLLASNLVSVQPLQGPSGLGFNFKHWYKDDKRKHIKLGNRKCRRKNKHNI